MAISYVTISLLIPVRYRIKLTLDNELRSRCIFVWKREHLNSSMRLRIFFLKKVKKRIYSYIFIDDLLLGYDMPNNLYMNLHE